MLHQCTDALTLLTPVLKQTSYVQLSGEDIAALNLYDGLMCDGAPAVACIHTIPSVLFGFLQVTTATLISNQTIDFYACGRLVWMACVTGDNYVVTYA